MRFNTATKMKSLQIDKIITSDLGRAFITGYIIASELGYKDNIERSKSLGEVNYGDLTNQPYSVYPDVTPDENTNYRPPNGESLAQMQKRVLEYLVKLDQEYEDKNILIVAHDGTINAVRANFTGETMGTADLTHNPHEFVAKFKIEDGKVTYIKEV
jgi:broad specificity phosphatase PhoE